jgi:hypothetical protein
VEGHAGAVLAGLWKGDKGKSRAAAFGYLLSAVGNWNDREAIAVIGYSLFEKLTRVKDLRSTQFVWRMDFWKLRRQMEEG